ncbi:hypothetical protein RBU61_16920 [Tissierella sp. MB52-C2]|uniref:hypothetical protein n=1 Tax=Tissierella sp. MB52-C2 TaxID=3070999 RepID=UPI00280BA8EA|nr:hypothetical protein [Tissierella sp. MB52-C2]WMM24593.1 hypothetical protein RBU61_16920 [Tissierella sp. MB52-C2]
MKRSLKVLSMLLFIILLISNNSLVYADDEVIFRAPSDGATFWQVESKTLVGTSYGSYRNGPQASNGITASMSKMTGTSIQYQHVLSGNYGDKLKIGNSFGVTFGKNYSQTSSFSHTAPKNRTIRLRYRPYYNKYKVVERQYTRLDGKSIKTNTTRTSYAEIFQNWDCTWIYIN